MNLILLGAPGVGKGTQAKKLSDKLGLAHISTGDLLREALKTNSLLAKKAKGFMDKGELVPDELVAEFLKDRMNKADIKNGFILDGYPRNLNQAKVLDGLLNKNNTKINHVLYLDADVSVIIERLSGRRICPHCAAVFHIKNMPPKEDMKCDFCGSELYQRKDDYPETIKNRLNVYKEETHSLIDYYNKRGILKKFTANEEAGLVFDKILTFLKNGANKN